MFLEIPIVIIINAFITGVFTKAADLFVEHGYKSSTTVKILLGIAWGFFGSLVVIGSPLLGAFYFAILLSWIIRYKLDFYNHGIGGALILLTIFYVRPAGELVTLILVPTLILFTVFGVLSREHKMKKKLSWFHRYNIYSFIYLAILASFYSEVWIVFIASLANVFGYHGIRYFFKEK
ncbi:hypothetical protein CMI38_03300 [Candidatus Pacearchaeota archaeon]|jgi:hypothetical protein|nr:hypothetical protein [Candidatus Pacearchaeota archaeon]|tara:strand:- start:1041 stop:1574 length:534 start_codon:yes stop_codon:yes gene_type:complete